MPVWIAVCRGGAILTIENIGSYTNEASLKHTYTLITVDTDEVGGDSA